ncbi:MAG TPA: hypothetical protein EYN91_25145 [Candidatus Melainabacteria bacterium]|nr:hypothetical protein [Candidatus Melainabacteria bacterium]
MHFLQVALLGISKNLSQRTSRQSRQKRLLETVMKRKSNLPSGARPVGNDKARINSLRGESPFVIKPLLQFAPEAESDGAVAIELVWIAHVKRSLWKVEYLAEGAVSWIVCDVEKVDSVTIKDNEFKRFRALLKGLKPGSAFEYRVSIAGQQVFAASAKTPPGSGCKTTVALFGDFADGDPEATKVAKGAYKANADMVILVGDVVYNNGLYGEYRKHFDPVYNGDGERGAPIGRSVVTAAVPGNHDVRVPDRFDFIQHASDADLFAFFRIFRHPNNGPKLDADVLSKMVERERDGQKLLKLYGPDFIKLSNYYFRQGDSFWVMLDANEYLDWRNPDLHKWLEKALAKGADCTWKFVCFHQPGFNSDAKYKTDTRMRVLSPIFEASGVDIVFSGHCHFYERSYPLKYKIKSGKAGRKLNPEGTMVLDKVFDGDKNNKPQGVIYIVSGAGGLLVTKGMRPSSHGKVESSFKIGDRKNSFTVLSLDGKVLTLRQVDTAGGEVDKFLIDKN